MTEQKKAEHLRANRWVQEGNLWLHEDWLNWKGSPENNPNWYRSETTDRAFDIQVKMEAEDAERRRIEKSGKTDSDYMRTLLPSHYTVSHDRKGDIRCKSSEGILQDGDAEDGEHWGYIMQAMRSHFGDRFLSVDHIVCFGHKDFMVYLKRNDSEVRQASFPDMGCTSLVVGFWAGLVAGILAGLR